ncbi:hypothetical protein ACIBH1_34065 [Nonomuraea sp. NPDC050663]|uniref:hypothetical protein n=1 Tax=Nonomuraea sp. NPDC050663 TaxID=3364370 RepID=UPI0037AEC2D5
MASIFISFSAVIMSNSRFAIVVYAWSPSFARGDGGAEVAAALLRGGGQRGGRGVRGDRHDQRGAHGAERADDA